MVLSVFATNKVASYQLLGYRLRRRPGHQPGCSSPFKSVRNRPRSARKPLKNRRFRVHRCSSPLRINPDRLAGRFVEREPQDRTRHPDRNRPPAQPRTRLCPRPRPRPRSGHSESDPSDLPPFERHSTAMCKILLRACDDLSCLASNALRNSEQEAVPPCGRAHRRADRRPQR